MQRYARMWVFCLAFIFCACLIPYQSNAAEEKGVTLRYSTMFPAPHRQSQVVNEWSKEVEKQNERQGEGNGIPGQHADACRADV